MTLLRQATATFLLLALTGLAAPLAAAEAVFPPGSRIGLQPPAGFAVAEGFTGFIDKEENVSFLIVEIADAPFAQIAATSDEQWAGQGIAIASRRSLRVDDAPAMLLTGAQTLEGGRFAKWILFVGYDDMSVMITVQSVRPPTEALNLAIETALKTTIRRKALTIDEKLAVLPFRLAALGDLRIVDTLANAAVFLTRGPKDAVRGAEQPFLIVARSPASPPGDLDLDALSRLAVRSLKTVEVLEIERSGTAQTDGDTTVELVARGRTRETGEAIIVWQWMRQLDGGYLRMVGISAVADRKRDLAVYREIRDGLRLR